MKHYETNFWKGCVIYNNDAWTGSMICSINFLPSMVHSYSPILSMSNSSPGANIKQVTKCTNHLFIKVTISFLFVCPPKRMNRTSWNFEGRFSLFRRWFYAKKNSKPVYQLAKTTHILWNNSLYHNFQRYMFYEYHTIKW